MDMFFPTLSGSSNCEQKAASVSGVCVCCGGVAKERQLKQGVSKSRLSLSLFPPKFPKTSVVSTQACMNILDIL